MTEKKMIVSAAEVLRQAKAHAKGGAKPSWAGQQAYVGEPAVKDWENMSPGRWAWANSRLLAN